MRPQVAIPDDLKNFIKAVFCVLKKAVFVTAVPKGKEYLTAEKRQYKYTKYLQCIGYLLIKFNKVELIENCNIAGDVGSTEAANA